MSYLTDNFKYQRSPALYKLEKLDNDLRRQLMLVSTRNPANSKDQVERIVKNSQNELKALLNQIKGVNWYAFILGVVLYHTQYIFRKKILLNEMGAKAVPHMAVCTAVGLLSGSFIGYTTASNWRLYRKYNSVQRHLESAAIKANI